MKFTTVSALLALAATVSAIPAEQELEKRAVCTIFGFTYSCAGTTTTAAAATTTAKATTPAATSVKTTATTGKATSTTSTKAGTSTGGASKYTSGDTADDIEDDSGCTALTVIYARGTSESGNIGSVAGPPMFKQLLSDLGASKLTLQGVDYPANAAGDTASCGAAGGPDMANLTTTILARCPNTKVALTGYSQGACVVHNAAADQGLTASQISAVVLFGDPFNGQAVGKVPSSDVLEICGSSDSICDAGGSDVSGSHLDYGSDAAMAATFIEKTTGVTA